MIDNKTPGYLLFLVSRAHHNLADRVFSQMGLCRGQVPVLFELGKKDAVTQCELAEKLELTQATLTNTLQRMEIAGLVTRERDSVDGRYTRIHLTDPGRKALDQANHSTQIIDETAFAGFSLDEQQILTRSLEKIHTNLNRD